MKAILQKSTFSMEAFKYIRNKNIDIKHSDIKEVVKNFITDVGNNQPDMLKDVSIASLIESINEQQNNQTLTD